MRILYETHILTDNHLLFFFYLIAIFFAIYTIISKNPIISVLFLIGLFFSISLYLINIGLHFMGLVYLIVYVGAVSILFLFILMLINVRVSELLADNRNSIPLAILTILCFNYSVNETLSYDMYTYIYETFDINYIKYLYNYINNIFSVQILNETNDVNVSILKYFTLLTVGNVSSKTWDGIIITNSHISSIGNILYTNLFALFIIIAFILLLAMVGAIIITLNKSRNTQEWNLSKLENN